MDAIRVEKAVSEVLRLGLSGLVAGFAGGAMLVALVFAFDIAHLRSLVAVADVMPTPWDWLQVPLVFAVFGMALAAGSGGGKDA